jgi:hypothetical protein
MDRLKCKLNFNNRYEFLKNLAQYSFQAELARVLVSSVLEIQLIALLVAPVFKQNEGEIHV